MKINKICICVIGVLFLIQNVVDATAQMPIPGLIADAKKCVLPIVCYDSLSDSSKQGTAVIVGDPNKILLFALTCEHVIAIKDSTGKTLRYTSDIALFVNQKDGSSIPINAQRVYTNEEYDFAVLAIPFSKRTQSLLDQLDFKRVQPSLWKETSDIKEGEPVIYIGYPLSKGIGKQNHPISRTGVMSQLVDGRASFLIDGFVQHGHSGSPVFLLREVKSRHWFWYLIGITTSFPKEYSDVYEKIGFKKAPGIKALINPGFTNVTAMDKIIPVLERLSK